MAASVIHVDYYIGDLSNQRSQPMSTFREFVDHLQSIQANDQRQQARKISPQGSLLEKRSQGVGVEFRYIMAADFILFLAGSVRNIRWYPFTLVYATIRSVSFEIFARSSSLAYFSKIRPMLGVSDINEFRQLIDKLEASDTLPRFDYSTISPVSLTFAAQIGTRP
ncbi:hypothetical protein [Methylobacterium sp. WL103]|uniref:hypothetical protein n=1 Tax=Methylobacterium sp. WL103 TaxID=2603891 RepID=UPI001AEF0E6F|nr:hypothetical protein [Methylobacterium sp. WL103]